MVIGGLQKLSLVDYPNKVAAIVFTQGCLFRCPYCHNPELIPVAPEGAVGQACLLEGDILNYLEEKKHFLDGVSITGGEPTIHHDLPEFIKKIKDLGLLVKLDTSGVNPRMIQKLIDEKLVDYFAMDLKNSWENYAEVIKISNDNLIKNCQKTFSLIQNSGIDHEFRTTVFPEAHTPADFFKIAGYLQKGEKYYIQNIEFKKNLDKNIDRTKLINVTGLVKNLRDKFPALVISERK
ncbi:MAG: anaerobic ribonucleoside-triphosphate reductase activating protein [bacterium]|nr:anaerobic ribonucleoside-triphosphate reductase activating protein [bacterium]